MEGEESLPCPVVLGAGGALRHRRGRYGTAGGERRARLPRRGLCALSQNRVPNAMGEVKPVSGAPQAPWARAVHGAGRGGSGPAGRAPFPTALLSRAPPPCLFLSQARSSFPLTAGKRVPGLIWPPRAAVLAPRPASGWHRAGAGQKLGRNRAETGQKPRCLFCRAASSWGSPPNPAAELQVFLGVCCAPADGDYALADAGWQNAPEREERTSTRLLVACLGFPRPPGCGRQGRASRTPGFQPSSRWPGAFRCSGFNHALPAARSVPGCAARDARSRLCPWVCGSWAARSGQRVLRRALGAAPAVLGAG